MCTSLNRRVPVNISVLRRLRGNCSAGTSHNGPTTSFSSLSSSFPLYMLYSTRIKYCTWPLPGRLTTCNFLNPQIAADMAGSHFEFVGDWRSATRQDIKALEKELCLGDRLEFDRCRVYQHWGIYVGVYDTNPHAVIHFGIFEGVTEYIIKKVIGRAGFSRQNPKIRADTIEKILGGSGKVRINNSRDKKVSQRDPQEVVGKAKEMHRDQTQMDYNLVGNNCEHFVNFCRYRIPHSDQVPDGKKVETCRSSIYLAVGMTGLFVAIDLMVFGYIKSTVHLFNYGATLVFNGVIKHLSGNTENENATLSENATGP